MKDAYEHGNLHKNEYVTKVTYMTMIMSLK